MSMYQDDFAADAMPVGLAHSHAGHGLPAGLFEGANARMLSDMPVRLSVEVGSASLRLRDVMALGEGSVVELDRQADALIDVKVNGTLIARGEVVSTNGRFGIRLIEVVDENDLPSPSCERRT